MVNKMSFSCHRNGQQSEIQFRIFHHFHIKNMEMLEMLALQVICIVRYVSTHVCVAVYSNGCCACVWRFFDLVFYWRKFTWQTTQWMTKRTPLHLIPMFVCLDDFVCRFYRSQSTNASRSRIRKHKQINIERGIYIVCLFAHFWLIFRSFFFSKFLVTNAVPNHIASACMGIGVLLRNGSLSITH